MCRLFFAEAVQPILASDFPKLQYAAGLLGEGSEVLGFDTPMSMDHDWGPRLQLFLAESDKSEAVKDALTNSLPTAFLGFPNHQIEVHTPRSFLLEYLGYDLDQPLDSVDWLTFPSQSLRTLADGPIYHDEIGLSKIRGRFSQYPGDVRLYLLGCAWQRVGQEEHLVGRSGQAGDELGATIIAARIVRDLMRIAFLLEGPFAPYAKWFGTAFRGLSCAGRLGPLLSAVTSENQWQGRDAALAAAFQAVADLNDETSLIPPVHAQVGPFHTRPFSVIEHHANFAQAYFNAIEDPILKQLSTRPIGSVDLFSDSTDLLSYPGWRLKLKQLLAPS